MSIRLSRTLPAMAAVCCLLSWPAPAQAAEQQGHTFLAPFEDGGRSGLGWCRTSFVYETTFSISTDPLCQPSVGFDVDWGGWTPPSAPYYRVEFDLAVDEATQVGAGAIRFFWWHPSYHTVVLDPATLQPGQTTTIVQNFTTYPSGYCDEFGYCYPEFGFLVDESGYNPSAPGVGAASLAGTVTEIRVIPGAAGGDVPDLHLSSLVMDPYCGIEGESLHATVNVTNQGSTASPPSSLLWIESPTYNNLDWEDAWGERQRVPIPPLAAGATIQMSWDWTADQVDAIDGPAYVWAVADPDGLLAEDNERTDNSEPRSYDVPYYDRVCVKTAMQDTTVDPGGTIEATFTVTNLLSSTYLPNPALPGQGQGIDIQAVTAGAGWSTTVDAARVTLARGESRDVHVRVVAPSSSPYGADTVVTARPTGDTNGNREGRASFHISLATIQRGVELTPSSQSQDVSAKGSVTYQITVQNTGNRSDRFTLSADAGKATWGASLNATSVTLAAGASTTVALTVTAGKTGTATATVTATSAADATATDSATCRTSVVR